MTPSVQKAAYQLDSANMCLWYRNGSVKRLDLPPRTFDVLRFLVENEGRLVSHDELLTAVWGNTPVQPEVLKSHILRIRNLLGDDSSTPRFVETLRGRGYRFIGSISHLETTEDQSQYNGGTRKISGRDEPLRLLHSVLDQAFGGNRQAVFICGEPGIGKTALVDALVARARQLPGLVVAQGQCVGEFGGIEPYYPVLEALGSLCNGPFRSRVRPLLLKLAPAWAEQIAEFRSQERHATAPLPLDISRGRMLREGAVLFEALAVEQPLLLVLEDLHWSDFATVDLVSALCRRRSAAKLMLVVTYQPDTAAAARHRLRQIAADLAARKHCVEIDLAPLSEAAIAQIVAGGEPEPPADRSLVELVARQSGGNPLFIGLILDYLQQQGVVFHLDQRWLLSGAIDPASVATPPTLLRLIETAIDRLPAVAQRVLEAASVVGLKFDIVTSAAAAGFDELEFEAVCEDLVRRRCAIHHADAPHTGGGTSGRSYGFDHATFRQVIYDRIGLLRRARLHQAVGERLARLDASVERDELSATLTQHFIAAGDWPRALDQLRAALRVASRRFARREALVILEQASAVAAHLPREGGAAIALELTERRAGIEASMHDPMARASYAALVEHAERDGDVDAMCRGLLGLAYVMSWTDLDGSRHPLERALALSARQPDLHRRYVTEVLAYTRRIWSFGWDPNDAQRCEAALTHLRSGGDPLSIARAELQFAMICMLSTRYREARTLVDSNYRRLGAAPWSEIEADVARAFWTRHVGVPWARYAEGDLGGAWAEYCATIEAFEQAGDTSAALSFRVYQATLRLHAMDYEGVLQACAPALESWSVRAQGSERGLLPVEHRIAQIYCGLAEIGLGDGRGALARFRAVEAEMARTPAHLDWYWRLPLQRGVIDAHLATGAPAAASTASSRLIVLARDNADRMWQALAFEALARTALATGELAIAASHVEQALEACRGVTIPLAEMRARATAASVHDAAGDHAARLQHEGEGKALRDALLHSLDQANPLRPPFERRSLALFDAGSASNGAMSSPIRGI